MEPPKPENLSEVLASLESNINIALFPEPTIFAILFGLLTKLKLTGNGELMLTILPNGVGLRDRGKSLKPPLFVVLESNDLTRFASIYIEGIVEELGAYEPPTTDALRVTVPEPDALVLSVVPEIEAGPESA